MAHANSLGKPSNYQRLIRWLIVVVVLGTVAVELAAPVLAWRWWRQPYLGLLFEHTLAVSNMGSGHRAAGLPGDASTRLVAIDGQPVANSRQLGQIVRTLSPGQPVTLTFQRRGADAPFRVQTTVQKFPIGDWISFFWLPYAVGLVYLAIGLWVFRHRGNRRPGQSFTLFCTLVALTTATLFDMSTTHVFVRIWAAALPLAGAALLHLALVFPEEGPSTRRQPLLRFVPYAPALVLVAVAQARLYVPGAPWAYVASWRWIYGGVGLAIVAYFGLMLYTRTRTVSAIVRQQVRIILLGGVLAFVPLAVYMVLAGLGVQVLFQPEIYLPPLVLFPVFVAFAILRYKLLGMDLIVSRGLAYAILTASVAGAYFLALTVLGQTLGITIAHNNPLLLAAFVALLIFFINPLRAGTERLADQLLGRHRVDYGRAMQTFSRELASTPLELTTVLQRLLDQITPVSHSAPALIFLYDPRLGRYTLCEASGFVAPEDQEVGFSRESGLDGWLSEEARPLYFLDSETQVRVPRLPADEQARIRTLGLVLFLPLRGQPQHGAGGEQLRGWVALGPRLSGEPYSPNDLAFLAALVDQTAIAIENAQLLTEARRRADELVALQQTALDISAEQEIPLLLQSIVERATRLLDASGGGVFLAQDEGARLRMVVSYNLGRDYAGLVLQRGEGIAGQVAQRGQPVRVESYQQFANRAAAFADSPARSVLGVPLKRHDQVLGVLTVADTSQTRLFTKEDEWLLTLFASQAAIALRNAQLFADLEERVSQVDALRQISEAVDLRQDLETLLHLIYTQAGRLLDIDNFYVALYDGDRQEFHMAYYVERGERHEPPSPRWPLGQGLTSEIVRSQQAIVTDDYLAECQQRGVPSGGKAAQAWLGVPLMSDNRVLGVLNVSSFQVGYRYTPEQVQLMTAIADQAAMAIDRMWLYQQMQNRAAELATLNEVSRTINSTLDLPSVLDLIMGKVIEILNVEAGSLLLLDEEAGDLVFRVALGTPGSQDLVGRHHSIEKGIVGQVARSGQALIVNDVRADPHWNEKVDRDIQFVTRSVLAVPMVSRDRVIGVIEVLNHRDGSPFLEEEAQLLIGFAAQAAVAIDNARLYTQTDQALAERVEELSTMQRIDRQLNAALDFDRVMDMTLDWALRVTGAPAGVIALYDQEKHGLLLLTSRGYPPEYERYRTEIWPLDKGVVGRVIRSGEAVLLQDTSQDSDYYPAQPATRSQLTVPIRREEQVLGVVNLESPETHAFDLDDLAYVERLVDHAAIAIENARLYRGSQRRAEDMALLYDISLTISSHLALDQVLEAVYEQIQAVWNPPVFFIALYDREGDALDFAIYVDREGRLEPFRQYLAEKSGFSAWIVRSRQPLLIRDWEKEAAASPIQGIPVGEVTRSWLGVPLVVGDEIVGVMSMQDYVPNAFSEEHQRFLSTIATEVAIAIENARLYQETQQRLKELALLFDTSAALSTSLDVNRVLLTTAEQITSALAADGCAISVWDREEDALITLLDYSLDPEWWQPEEPGTVYPLDDYPASRQVLTGRRPLAVQTGEAGADVAEREWMVEQEVASLIMVPMIVRDQAIGMLELMQCHEAREFTATEVRLCQTLANQAAAALENARLYEGVKDANEAKSEFIDFVAHELKQPMTAMQGYARMLTMGIGGELTEMQHEFVRVINSNVDRMGKLVNDLLEISRLEAGRTKLKLAPVQIGEVVAETVANTRTEVDARHHALVVDAPEQLPPVMDDRDRLIQILTNLVSNAYKYTPEGGRIEIAVDGQDDAEAPPGYLQVAVSDTGIGMSPKEVANLEEKFFRADHDLVRAQPGTGLGVSITRNLVALHGGELTVESEPGKGSTFRFTMPVASYIAG